MTSNMLFIFFLLPLLGVLGVLTMLQATSLHYSRTQAVVLVVAGLSALVIMVWQYVERLA